MTKSLRRVLALVALAVVAGSFPVGAPAASRCDSQLVVFSRNSGNLVGSVNWNGVICFPGNNVVEESKAVADGPVDFRLINPQSDLLQIRYADNIKGRPAFAKAKLNGLGYANRIVILSRNDADLTGEEPSWVYDSGDLALDPAASGCLTVKAWYTKKKNGRTIKVSLGKTAYHTFDNVC